MMTYFMTSKILYYREFHFLLIGALRLYMIKRFVVNATKEGTIINWI